MTDESIWSKAQPRGISRSLPRRKTGLASNTKKSYIKSKSHCLIFYQSIVGGLYTIISEGKFTQSKLRFALVINEDIDYNVVKKKIQRRYDKGRFAGKSIEDYIAHEMAHIMTYQDCKNEAEFRTRQRIVERQFMQGISQYADKTGKGEESLAEAFVRYRNKEKIPIRAELLIRSYIERWKK